MKLISKDERTGYKVGEIVEMSQDELNKAKFNVFFEVFKESSSKVIPDKKSLENDTKDSVLFDLNDDGVFDEKDVSIAAKAMVKHRIKKQK